MEICQYPKGPTEVWCGFAFKEELVCYCLLFSKLLKLCWATVFVWQPLNYLCHPIMSI